MKIHTLPSKNQIKNLKIIYTISLNLTKILKDKIIINYNHHHHDKIII